MKTIRYCPVVVVALAFLTGCNRSGPEAPAPATPEKAAARWSVEPVATITGLHVPESVLWICGANDVYVSNIESKPDEYWTDDGKGYLATVGPDHRVTVSRWVDSKPDAVINAPKGLCNLGAHIYFTDNSRLLRCSAASGTNVEVVASGFLKANDLTTDGKAVWMSDTGAGEVYRISPNGERKKIPAPEAVNGLTFSGKRLFAVSWGLHDVYELDPLGEKDPVAFGLADHFSSLDGIEILYDGTFVVADFVGNKVCTISPDRTTVHTLVELTTPADIGLNERELLLYVPQLKADKVAVFQLQQKP